MSFFAEINDENIVVRVIVASSKKWCTDNLSGNWVETKYDGSLRKQFANIGFQYDKINDVFIAPQPDVSYILNDNFDWIKIEPLAE